MNASLKDVTGIGRPYVENIVAAYPIELGSVISFSFANNDPRKVHMIICHDLGEGGWNSAEKYVRFGLDYLWHTEPAAKKFSIVNIGTGRVGKRDKADHATIRSAIANSFLPVRLYIWDQLQEMEMADQIPVALMPYRRWDMRHGEKRIQLASEFCTTTSTRARYNFARVF